MFSNGILNLTNWTANLIMPTLAGLFLSAAVYRFSKAQPYSHLSYAGFAALMCSGLLRLLETFAQQAGGKADGLYRHPGALCEISNLHDSNLNPLLRYRVK